MTNDYFVPKRDARAEGSPYHPDYAIKLAKEGKFPSPMVLSPRRVGWLKSQLVRYLEDHTAA